MNREIRIFLILFLGIFTGCKEDIYTQYKKSEILLEYPCPPYRQEIEKIFPMLKILDEQIDWTAGVRWYKVQDKKTKEKFEIFKNPFGDDNLHFRKKIDGKYWFWDLNNPIKWRYKNWKTNEKEYLND